MVKVFILYYSSYIPAYEDGTDSVPKRRHTKFRRRGITEKKTYNIHNTAKVWNQECCRLLSAYQLFEAVYCHQFHHSTERTQPWIWRCFISQNYVIRLSNSDVTRKNKMQPWAQWTIQTSRRRRFVAEYVYSVAIINWLLGWPAEVNRLTQQVTARRRRRRGNNI
jgi:hypothetical protein